MATQPTNQQPTSGGTPSQQGPADSSDSPRADEQPDHGSTGEGAGSAMARLISQQQARIVPGAPEDPPTGST